MLKKIYILLVATTSLFISSITYSSSFSSIDLNIDNRLQDQSPLKIVVNRNDKKNTAVCNGEATFGKVTNVCTFALGNYYEISSPTSYSGHIHLSNEQGEIADAFYYVFQTGYYGFGKWTWQSIVLMTPTESNYQLSVDSNFDNGDTCQGMDSGGCSKRVLIRVAKNG